MNNIYGLIGEKLTHSLSPIIHSHAFQKSNIDGNYFLFEVEGSELKNVVSGCKALKFKGLNVTIPYKIKIMEYVDEISKEAKEIGSVNTIAFKNGKTIGYNTDYFGFGMLLSANEVCVKNKTCIILGSGGACKAVFQYIKDNGAKKIYIASRNVESCKKEYGDCEAISYEQIALIDDKDIIINTTPVGMHPNIDESPLREETVKEFKAVIDLIYNPTETLLIKYAKNHNIKAANGLYMLVGQAVKAEEIWNDIQLSKGYIDDIYLKILETI